MMNDQNQMYMH